MGTFDVNKMIKEANVLDSKWNTFEPTQVQQLHFVERGVQVDGVRYAFTKQALTSLLKKLQLGNYQGSAKAVAEYMYDNRTHDGVIDELNQIVEMRSNRDELFNIRANDGTIYGFDNPKRQYMNATDIVGGVLENVGNDFRLTDYVISPEIVKVVGLTKEFVSKENYGLGFEATVPMTGTTRTSLAPVTKQAYCDNSIRSPFVLTLNNSAANLASNYKMLVGGTTGMVDNLVHELYAFEQLVKYQLSFNAWEQILVDNRIKLDDEHYSAMYAGNRGSETLWGWSNGLTYAVNTVPTNERVKNKAELFVGKLSGEPEKYIEV